MNLSIFKKNANIQNHNIEQHNRLVEFDTYDEFQEKRVFPGYRIVIYIGVFLELAFILLDYANHGLTAPFYYLAFGRCLSAFFTSMIIVVTFSDVFQKHRGLWIIIFGNLSLVSLLTGYITQENIFNYIPYNWVYFMISTSLLAPLLGNRAFVIVHTFSVVYIVWLMKYMGLNLADINLFIAFIVTALLYLWVAIAAFRSEARKSYLSAYQNHIYMTLDTLSQLLNRREFYLRSIEQWKNSNITNEPLSFIMIDIDFFKRINDTYGHHCGDIAIQTVSTIILEHTNDHKIIGRLGGEEFGITLPYTPLDGAISMAERIRHVIEETTIHFNENTISLTISIGVATKTGTLNDFDAMVKEGDKNLYLAKNEGRNKIVYSVPS
jgi:diguanylate cyclase (GGDEF)-like protein